MVQLIKQIKKLKLLTRSELGFETYRLEEALVSLYDKFDGDMDKILEYLTFSNMHLKEIAKYSAVFVAVLDEQEIGKHNNEQVYYIKRRLGWHKKEIIREQEVLF